MFQSFIIIGNATRDAELKMTPQAKPVTSFTVAVNEKRNGEVRVMWVNVTAWDKLAEVVGKYVKKGMLVLVEGRLSPDLDGNPRMFQRKDGTNGSAYEMVASKVKFLSKSADEPESADW